MWVSCALYVIKIKLYSATSVLCFTTANESLAWKMPNSASEQDLLGSFQIGENVTVSRIFLKKNEAIYL